MAKQTPRYQSRVGAQNSQAQEPINPAAAYALSFGAREQEQANALTYRGMAQLGAGIEQLGQGMQRKQVRDEEKARIEAEKQAKVLASHYALDALVKAETGLARMYQEAQQSAKPGGDFGGEMSQKTAEFLDEFMANAPNDYAKEMLASKFAGLQISAFEKAFNQQTNLNAAATASRLDELTNIRVRSLQEGADISKVLGQSAADAAILRNVLPPDKALMAEKAMKQNLVEQYFMILGEKDPKRIKEELDTGKFDGILSADQKSALRSGGKRLVKEQEREVEQKFREERAAFAEDLKKRSLVGEVSEKEVQEAFKDGLLTAAEFKSINSNRANVADLTKLDQVEAGLLDGSIAPNPKDLTQKAAAGSVLSRMISSDEFKSLSPDNQLSKVSAVTASLGVIPDEMRDQIKSFIQSESPEKRAYAVELISRLDEAKPAILQQFDKQSVLFGRNVKELQKAGMPLQEAITQVGKRVFELDKDTLKIRDKMVSGELKQLNYDDALSQLIPDLKFWSTDHAVDFGNFDVIKEDFNTLFRSYTEITGDPISSYRMAQRDIKTRWGVSEVGDKNQWMRRPPEKVYEIPGVKPDWIKEQFNQDTAIIPKAKGDKFFLVSDDETLTTPNPTYLLFRETKEGLLAPVLDEKSGLVRWAPDIQKKMEELQNSDTSAFKQLKQDRLDKAKRELEAEPSSGRPGGGGFW